MDWIMTPHTRKKEDTLLSDYWLAVDKGNQPQQALAHLDILEYYAGVGCPSPDVALLAALLLDPHALSAVREMVKPPMLPRHNDSVLYAAMLRTPAEDDLAEWWRALARISGLSLAEITAYLQYQYFDVRNCGLYAETILRTYVHAQAFAVAEKMIGALYAGNQHAIKTAIGALTELDGIARPVSDWRKRW